MIFGDRTSPRRSGHRWLRLAGCLGISSCLAAVACINIDPSWDEADTATASGTVPVACQQCREAPSDPGPGCADELAVCNANETCVALDRCVILSGCHPSENLQGFLGCARPCADEHGVTLYDDIYQIAMPLGFCVMDNCEAECSVPVTP